MILAVAHRGYSSRYPENTALAFEKAIAAGSDYIETDLRFSRDGAIVCSHDDSFERVAGVSQMVNQLSLTEIRTIRLPGGFGILGIDEVFAIARGQAKVMLDVKVINRDMAERAIAAARDAGMAGDIMFGARSPDMAQWAFEIDGSVPVLAMPGNDIDFHAFIGMPVAAFRLYEDAANSASVIAEAGYPLWITGGRRSLGEAAGSMTSERLDMLEQIAPDAILVNDPLLILQRRQGLAPDRKMGALGEIVERQDG